VQSDFVLRVGLVECHLSQDVLSFLGILLGGACGGMVVDGVGGVWGRGSMQDGAPSHSAASSKEKSLEHAAGRQQQNPHREEKQNLKPVGVEPDVPVLSVHLHLTKGSGGEFGAGHGRVHQTCTVHLRFPT